MGDERPLKVVHLTTVHHRHDTRIWVKELYSLRSATDFKISLVVFDRECESAQWDGEDSGVDVYCGGAYIPNRVKRIALSPIRAFWFVRKLGADVVHIHDPELLIVAPLFALQGVKVIYDVHEDVPRQVLTKGWIPEALKPVVSTIVDLAERALSKGVWAVVCATEEIAKRFTSVRVEVVKNYPLISEFNETPEDYSAREDRVGYVGAISEARGVWEMIKAANLGFGDKSTLCLAGPFESEALKEAVRSSAGSDVLIVGRLSRAEVGEFVSSIRVGLVVLQPTQSYKEALPVKLFEYMAAGVPVVASDFPKWRTIVSEADCGLLVDPMDPVAISSAVRWLLDNREEAERMGRNGRQSVLNSFNWDREGQKLVSIYEKLL